MQGQPEQATVPEAPQTILGSIQDVVRGWDRFWFAYLRNILSIRWVTRKPPEMLMVPTRIAIAPNTVVAVQAPLLLP